MPTPEADLELWEYNCKDCVNTREIGEVLTSVIDKLGLQEVDAFQQKLFWPVLKAMNQGVRIDLGARKSLDAELEAAKRQRQRWIEDVIGHPINIDSPKQMMALFYNDLGQPPIMSKATKASPSHVTCNDDALIKIARREPLLKPLVQTIQEYRTIRVLLSTFVRMELDYDNRMRCSYNICGTETYRFNSRENAFGTGGNLQNVPKGGVEDEFDFVLPNIRKMFVPDPGYTFFDTDLSKADLRIVVWESGCKEMKRMLAEGFDPYIEAAREYFRDPTINKKLSDGSENPKYTRFKSCAHGCVTAGHEVLTPSGWVAVENYIAGTPIMTCSLRGEAWFEVPTNFLRSVGTVFHSIRGQSADFEFTADHRMPFTTDRDDNLQIRGIARIPDSARIPYTTQYQGGQTQITEVDVKLLAAFQADGTKDPHGNVLFHFARRRKIERLRELLAGKSYTESQQSDLSTIFYIPRIEAAFADRGKSAGPYLLDWPSKALDVYLDELVHWDGSSSGTVQCHVTSVDRAHCEWLQTIARLRGRGSQLNVQRPAAGNRQTLYRVSLNSRKFCNLSSTVRESYETAPKAIYCPTVSTGLFLLRRHDKIVVSGNTNYLGTPQGLASRLGLLVHEIERVQNWYFGRFPEIKAWQKRFAEEVSKTRRVRNKFGYVRQYFDRVDDSMIREAIAWLPQSTVACLINRVWMNLYNNVPEVEVLLQVHDSLAGQFPTAKFDQLKPAIFKQAEIVIPYEEPLIIPIGLKTSEKSWGDCD